MRISHKYKFVFLAYPRTGSTTVRAILDDYSDIKSVHISQTTKEFPFYDHILARELKPIFEKQGWDWFAYRRFCVVRNPYDRVVSLYHHYRRVNADKKKARKSFYYFLKYTYFKLRPELTFSAYVMRFNRTRNLALPLREFICDEDGEFLVDDVLPFEHLHTALPDYLRQMGILVNQDKIPILNASANRQPYAHYYTDETRREVEMRYAYEIERFSYAFDETVSDATVRTNSNAT